jgi:molybdopterin-guanine dinucleotide biosynthesis protein A
MGRDKALLPLNDKTLLEHVIFSMQQVFPKVIVSVREPRAGVELSQVCDEQKGSGPLAGLAAGLAKVTTPWAFIVACDMPYISVQLIEYIDKYRTECQAVVPVVGGYPQPLAAFYSVSSLDVIRQALAGQDKSLRCVLRQLDVCYVDEAGINDAALRSFVDLDTPEDYAAAVKNGLFAL